MGDLSRCKLDVGKEPMEWEHHWRNEALREAGGQGSR